MSRYLSLLSYVVERSPVTNVNYHRENTKLLMLSFFLGVESNEVVICGGGGGV